MKGIMCIVLAGCIAPDLVCSNVACVSRTARRSANTACVEMIAFIVTLYRSFESQAVSRQLTRFVTSLTRMSLVGPRMQSNH